MDVTITLGAAEIDEAIRDYVVAKSPVAVEGDLKVELIAGKGTVGHAAIIKLCSTVEEKKVPVKRLTKKTAGTDVTPVPLVEVVEEVKEVLLVEEPTASEGLKAAMEEVDDNPFTFGSNTVDNVDALFGA